jgi:hypothetical protein
MPRFTFADRLTGHMNNVTARILASLLLAALTLAGGAEAAEYRLEVLSMVDSAFQYYLGRDASLSTMAAAMRDNVVPKGVLLSDRMLRPAYAGLAQGFGGITVDATGAAETTLWPQVRWSGEPGQRVVFAIDTAGRQYQRVHHIGLGAGQTLRYTIPYHAGLSASRAQSITFPIASIQGWEGHDGAGRSSLARYLDLRDGVGLVVGNPETGVETDKVFIVVDLPGASTAFRVVLGWRQDASHHPAYEDGGFQ